MSLSLKREVGTVVRARLAFEDVSGLMRAEVLDALVERVQYKPTGSIAASFIVSFTFEGEMYEVAYPEASLDACVAAAAPHALSPPVVVVGAEFGRTLAVLARVARSAALLAAEPTKVCSAELQQLAEALAVPGGAKPFTHPGMNGLAQAGAHAMFAESQLQALESGSRSSGRCDGRRCSCWDPGGPDGPLGGLPHVPGLRFASKRADHRVRRAADGRRERRSAGRRSSCSSSSSWWDLYHTAGGRPGGQVHPRRVPSIPKLSNPMGGP